MHSDRSRMVSFPWIWSNGSGRAAHARTGSRCDDARLYRGEGTGEAHRHHAAPDRGAGSCDYRGTGFAALLSARADAARCHRAGAGRGRCDSATAAAHAPRYCGSAEAPGAGKRQGKGRPRARSVAGAGQAQGNRAEGSESTMGMETVGEEVMPEQHEQWWHVYVRWDDGEREMIRTKMPRMLEGSDRMVVMACLPEPRIRRLLPARWRRAQ